MSSNSYTAPCPVCDNDMDVCESNRPYPQTDCRCRVCWFTSYTVESRESLEAINANREEWGERLISLKEYSKYDNHEMFVEQRNREYNLQEDHVELLKQIKDWELICDRVVSILNKYTWVDTNLPSPEALADEIEAMSHEMWAINI